MNWRDSYVVFNHFNQYGMFIHVRLFFSQPIIIQNIFLLGAFIYQLTVVNIMDFLYMTFLIIIHLGISDYTFHI